MFDYLIVGAGFAGSVLAERLARGSNKRVLICDKRSHVGGNAYDHYDDAGLLVHKYGPHIFHTNSREVFEYLSEFTAWRAYEHRVLASVGRELYEKFFRGYTRKQWGLDPSELDAMVTARVPVRTNRDDRYFSDSYQAMPKFGFTRMFEN